MEKFSDIVKQATIVLGAIAGGALAAKGTYELVQFTNSVVAGSSLLSYWVAILPEGRALLASGVAGLTGGLMAGYGIDKLITQQMTRKQLRR